MSDMTPPPAPPAQPAPAAPAASYAPASENSKILAGIGYIFGVVALVALLLDPYKDEPFVKFHAVQALALWVLSAIAVVPVIGWLVWVVAVVFGIVAAINAFQGKYYEVPVLGGLIKGWFNV